jgi:6-methylsalicylate decarboxylase
MQDSGLIDVHAHFLTESYVRQAVAASHEHPDGMGRWPEWSVDAHLELMDRHGIETAVLSISSPGVHFGDDHAAGRLAQEVNEYAAGLSADHPGRFEFFASLPLPDVAGSLDELAYALGELGAAGVVMMTNAHGRYLGDPGLGPVFEELNRRRAVVFLHPTSPAGWERSALGLPRPMIEYIFDTARTVTDLVMSGTLERNPDLAVVVPHCGGAVPVLADRLDEFRRLFVGSGGTPSLEVVTQLRGLYYDLAGSAFPRQVPALLQLADADRLLFGSDYCWTPAALAEAHLAAIDAAPSPVDGASWRSLTTTNALRLLRRQPTG